MSEKVKEESVNVIDVTLERIKELNEIRSTIESKKNEVSVHQRDLSAIETINGVNSNEWKVKNELLKSCENELVELDKKVSELSFKKSELKPVLDDVAKKFEDELRAEQEREYHIEIGSVDEETGKGNGKKVYKELLEYIQKDVEWTAKTAPGLMMLERNMLENRAWTQAKEFDNVIILRSANVLVLWRSVLEEMHGKGSFEAKKFLSTWANCGQSITEAIRDIQKQHDVSRNLGTQLNIIEDEFERSDDDLPHDGISTTKEEVSPDV